MTDRTDPLPADVEPEYERLTPLIEEAVLAQRHDVRRYVMERATQVDYTVVPFDETGHLVVLIGGLPLRKVHWSELADTPHGAA
jgi:hypothetical protein